jgi:CheY-like chemotaxis protein
MNDRQHTILCVDDEVNILNSVKRLLRKENYRVLTAFNGAEALEVLEKNQVHLIISDQRMRGMSGTELMGIVKERYPDVIRIILSGFIDVDAITESVNKGHIYRFLLKPWKDHSLKQEIQKALDEYNLHQANKELYRSVRGQNEELKKMNENLEALVQERSEELLIQNQILALSKSILDDLPVPVIGVSAEGLIALTNREARNLSFGGGRIHLGTEIGHYFANPVRKMISAALETNASQILRDYPLSGISYEIHLIPLSGAFRGQGVILTLKSLTGSQDTSHQG